MFRPWRCLIPILVDEIGLEVSLGGSCLLRAPRGKDNGTLHQTALYCMVLILSDGTTGNLDFPGETQGAASKAS